MSFRMHIAEVGGREAGRRTSVSIIVLCSARGGEGKEEEEGPNRQPRHLHRLRADDVSTAPTVC